MIAIGKFNTLPISSYRDHIVYLADETGTEFPIEEPIENNTAQVGETIKVFVYTDGQGELKATLKTPLVEVDQIAFLKVVSLSRAGAFVDWGLSKDLLVPFSEQKVPMAEGKSYLVRLFLDEQNRIAASMLLDDFLQDEAFYYKEGQEVDIIIADPTPLGFKVVVDQRYWGVLYKDEIFQPLRRGMQLKAYVKAARSDHRLDVILNKDRYGEKVDATQKKILTALENHGGRLNLNDKTPPEVIYQKLAISKKIFKQAIGVLYKKRLIIIDEQGIRLP